MGKCDEEEEIASVEDLFIYLLIYLVKGAVAREGCGVKRGLRNKKNGKEKAGQHLGLQRHPSPPHQWAFLAVKKKKKKRERGKQHIYRKGL